MYFNLAPTTVRRRVGLQIAAATMATLGLAGSLASSAYALNFSPAPYYESHVAVAQPCANAETPVDLLATREAAEEAVLCLVNQERAAAGLAGLRLNDALRSAAEGHAEAAVAINGGVPASTPTRTLKRDRHRKAASRPPATAPTRSAGPTARTRSMATAPAKARTRPRPRTR